MAKAASTASATFKPQRGNGKGEGHNIHISEGGIGKHRVLNGKRLRGEDFGQPRDTPAEPANNSGTGGGGSSSSGSN
eukprot:134797-Alexandrium_andersonii.AAC.1